MTVRTRSGPFSGESLPYLTKENTKQRKVLERVQEVFRQLGYAVTLLPMEQVI
jgi:hypothetical protein